MAWLPEVCCDDWSRLCKECPSVLYVPQRSSLRCLRVRLQEDLQESFVKTLAPPDTADVQATLLPAVARPFLLVSYSEDDVLGVIDEDSFLA